MASPIRTFRDCLEDALLAPKMEPSHWQALAELSKRHPCILGTLAYIMDMCQDDEKHMALCDISEESGRLRLSNLQGQHLAKRHIVGHICDLLGDLALAEQEVVQDMDKNEMTPNWMRPDEEEEEERPRRPRSKPRPRPRQRRAPAPVQKKGKRK